MEASRDRAEEEGSGTKEEGSRRKIPTERRYQKADGSDTLAEKELEDITAKLAGIEKQLANEAVGICNDATTEKLAELPG